MVKHDAMRSIKFYYIKIDQIFCLTHAFTHRRKSQTQKKTFKSLEVHTEAHVRSHTSTALLIFMLQNRKHQYYIISGKFRQISNESNGKLCVYFARLDF